MIPVETPDVTRHIGEPKDWDEEKNGVCITIPVADVVLNGMPYMLTAWRITPEERQALIDGSDVLRLGILGCNHPVVRIWVA